MTLRFRTHQETSAAFGALLIAIALVLMPGRMDAACSIMSTRSTGIAPLAIQFDAVSTTMAASSRPFHDVDYVWDFGDASAGTWSTTGRSRNTAFGPVAGHVFLAGGTYTVTCTARDSAGNTSSAQLSITVTDADTGYAGTKTRCLSRSGDFTGAPSGAEQVTTTDLTPQITWLNAASGRRLLLRAGETWTYASTFDGHWLTAAHSLVGVFGAGTAPNFVLQAQSQYSPLFYVAANDIRITGLKIVGSGAGTRGIQGYTNGDDMLIMGCEVTNSDMALLAGPARSYLFDNYIHDIISYGLYMEGTRSLVLGNQILNIGVLHNIRIVAMKQSVVGENIIRWNGHGYHCFKLHAATYTGSDSYSEQIVISGNVIQGDSGLVIAPQNNTSDERIRDVLVERNTIIGAPNDTWLVHIAAASITFRNNILDSSSQVGNAEAFEVARRGVEPAPSAIEVYNNVFVKNGNSDPYYRPISFADTTNGVVRNNIIYCATFTGTLQTGWDIGAQGVSSNNLVYFPKTPSLCDDGTGAHVATNPLFVSVDAGNADYLKLQSTSPAIDRGYASTTTLRDYVGTIRPQGSAPDLGIYESISGTVAPVVTSFTPASGPVGTTVTITGTAFTGATAVAFHGTAATYTVNSATQITATVPAGATTGTISVTTSDGTAASASVFTVNSSHIVKASDSGGSGCGFGSIASLLVCSLALCLRANRRTQTRPMAAR